MTQSQKHVQLTDMETIRAFIALDLPDAVKETLDKVSQTLAQNVPPRAVRWVKPHTIHLTLTFLGETAVSLIPTLSQTLDQITPQHPPFTLQLDKLGFFPNPKRPRVIWVGLQGDLPPLQTLKKAIDQALIPHGWQPENKPFRAHLTIGRVKDRQAAQNIQWQATIPPLTIPATAVYLIRSQLRPNGPIYTIKHQSNLTL